MESTVTVKIDPENPAQQWWHALREHEPEIARRWSSTEDTIEVTATELDRLKALPGWSDGPEYARTALIVL